MAKERTSVRMQAQIKIMSGQGHSIRSIARVLKLSRRTVRKYLEPVLQPASEGGGWEEEVDWEYAARGGGARVRSCNHTLHDEQLREQLRAPTDATSR